MVAVARAGRLSVERHACRGSGLARLPTLTPLASVSDGHVPVRDVAQHD
jgi:hypothetical protein